MESDLSQEEIEKQHRDNLAWLVGCQGLVVAYRGNYVAIWRESILAVAPTEKLVRIAASRFKDVSIDEVLVVPLCVPGSEELWEEIEAMME